MIRSVFFSAGLYLVLCGSGLFFVDEITLTEPVSTKAPRLMSLISHANAGGQRAMNPPEWLPFLCIGLGGVTMLYAIALPSANSAGSR
ncbi:hypothetical protein [Planctomicrobium sp. SH664]|uniref:hypothetical protein n=1 Tax=Planctomicrobium sp. SH664 TaxID=3448125 RepID=UPI003F5BAE16